MKYEILITGEHSHVLLEEYDNLNVLHRKIKDVILELMDHGKLYPKQIHSHLTMNSNL